MRGPSIYLETFSVVSLLTFGACSLYQGILNESGAELTLVIGGAVSLALGLITSYRTMNNWLGHRKMMKKTLQHNQMLKAISQRPRDI